MSLQEQQESWDGIERRSGVDRRSRSHWYRPVLAARGRRRHARRAGDRINYYVDRYDRRWGYVTITILVLCCFDAIFTLNLIQQGIAVEANPIMRHLIERNLTTFFVIKYLLTAVGLLVLLMHKNFYIFRVVRVSHVLLGLLVMYALLIKYELVLFGLG